ncbi:hypothetical protein [Candidatus Methylocalor cossyra]|uniref:Uncharacterized protein n=1 Tax=Candidatus Methylocalor cossyra TaxID=3108543 RepID=A0ABM9NF88_9GAMM
MNDLTIVMNRLRQRAADPGYAPWEGAATLAGLLALTALFALL